MGCSENKQPTISLVTSAPSIISEKETDYISFFHSPGYAQGGSEKILFPDGDYLFNQFNMPQITLGTPNKYERGSIISMGITSGVEYDENLISISNFILSDYPLIKDSMHRCVDTPSYSITMRNYGVSTSLITDLFCSTNPKIVDLYNASKFIDNEYSQRHNKQFGSDEFLYYSNYGIVDLYLFDDDTFIKRQYEYKEFDNKKAGKDRVIYRGKMTQGSFAKIMHVLFKFSKKTEEEQEAYLEFCADTHWVKLHYFRSGKYGSEFTRSKCSGRKPGNSSRLHLYLNELIGL